MRGDGWWVMGNGWWWWWVMGDGWWWMMMDDDGWLMMDCIRGICVKDIWCEIIWKNQYWMPPPPPQKHEGGLCLHGCSDGSPVFGNLPFVPLCLACPERKREALQNEAQVIFVFFQSLCSFAVSLYIPAVLDWWSIVPLLCPMWGCAGF